MSADTSRSSFRIPGGGYLSHLLDWSSSLTCVGCGEAVRAKDEDVIVCDVPWCSGVFCRPCFLSLGSRCFVCTRPLTFQEDEEEERDSSDDEQLDLRPTAPNSPHLTEQTSMMLMRRRIRTAGSPQEASISGGTSGEVQRESSAPSGLSEADQVQPGSQGSTETLHHQEVELTEVSVHSVDRHGDQQASPGPYGTFQDLPGPGSL